MNSFYYDSVINHIADQLSNYDDWTLDSDESLEDVFTMHIKNSYPQIKLEVIRNLFHKYEDIDLSERMQVSFDTKNLVKSILKEDQITFSPEFISFLSNINYLDRDDVHKLINGIVSLDATLDHEDFLLVIKADF